MTMRLATPADIPAMHRVRMAVRENRLSDPGRVTLCDYAAAISERGRGWVAQSDGTVVGFAIAYHCGHIWALFVHPDHEGRGHGTALHAAMLAWLWARGLPELWLTTGRGTRAEAFYRAHGWRASGLMPNGEVRLERVRADSPPWVST